MKLITASAVLVAALSVTNAANAQVYTDGYFRGDGTYVQPHVQSSPDHSYNNNYGTRPNINPYSGSYGGNTPTLNDHTPSYNQQHYGAPLTTPSYGVETRRNR